jgi:hypothetical protein
VLREFFPAALEAFADLAAADTLELLAIAPDPDRAARLPKSKIVAVLRRANRRGVEEKAATIQSVWRAPALRQPTQVQAAFAVIVTSQVRLITALNLEIGQLGEVVAHHFGRHRGACRANRGAPRRSAVAWWRESPLWDGTFWPVTASSST